MATTIRPELSEKNPYWVEKHRYYELKHFCLQYPSWVRIYKSLDGLSAKHDTLAGFSKETRVSNPTEHAAIVKTYYSKRMDMLQNVAKQTDPELAEYILAGITEGVSYDILKARMNVPCCKDVYYNAYRKFFWLLNKERD